MSETEAKRKAILAEIEHEKEEAYHYLDGINLCVGRLKQLIKLDAPMVIVQNEIRMIEYRALSALSLYEAWALVKFALADEESNVTTTDPAD